MKSGFLKKKEIIILAAVALAAVACLLVFRRPAKGGGYASVNYNGEVVMEIPLKKDGVYHIDAALPVTLVVEDGEIRFFDSQCPDHLCEEVFGRISEQGEYAICMPARVAVSVEGAE